MEKVNTLVTGATGFIGKRLVSQLLQIPSYRVAIFTRQVQPAFSTDVRLFHGDMMDVSALRDAVSSVDVVFHVAGNKRDESQMQAINVNGTHNLLEASVKAGVKAFVFLSSAGVVGSHPADMIVRETISCHPQNEYEHSKYEAEKMVLAYADKMQVVALRPTNVFGDSDPEKHLKVLWRTIKLGQFIYIGDKEARQNYVYVEDCAIACVHLARLLLTGQVRNGEIFFLSDTFALHELVNSIADFLEVKRPGLFLPKQIGWLLAAFGESLSRVSGRQLPLSMGRWMAMNNLIVYDSSKIRQLIPHENFVGWREGIRRMIEWYERQ
ncbi:MAG: NAD-dependent epimerase/dehydratase family protein [Chloroflexota bacterium]